VIGATNLAESCGSRLGVSHSQTVAQSKNNLVYT
jgi:hypothetical protein